MPAPRTADWEEIERLYRDGVLTIAAIADQHGVTEGAVRKFAKAGKWVRSDAKRVRVLAQRIAADHTVAVYAEPGEQRTMTLAKVGATILEAHQRRFARLQGIVDKQVDELEEFGDTRDVLSDRMEEFYLTKAGDDPVLAGIYKAQLSRALAAIKLPSRAKILVDLVNATSRLTDLERKAFSLDDGNDGRSYEDLLAEIMAKGGV